MVYSLRKLDLVDIRFDTVWIESAISSPMCTGLEELCINHANANFSSWSNYDFARLSGLLVTHLPRLKTFEWTWYDWDKASKNVRPFGSLSGLQELTTLAVDYTLMTPKFGHNGDPMHLLNPHAYLPTSLKRLTIADIMEEDVSSLCRRYMQ
jgi:hypothetical protein